MARSAHTGHTKRPPRVKLAGSILALVQLENGRQVRAKLHQLSVTGGLLHIDAPMDEGIKVEVIFHIGETTVRGKARMLFPMWATQGYLQPFAFRDLEDKDRESLQGDLQKYLEPARVELPPQETAPENPAEPVAEELVPQESMPQEIAPPKPLPQESLPPEPVPEESAARESLPVD